VLRIRQTLVLDDQRKRLRAWQERVRDPSLTVLLVLELCTIFLAEPLAPRGLPIAQAAADTLVLFVVLIVVASSHRRGAILFILLGLAATGASFLFGPLWSPVTAGVVRRGGNIVVLSALT